MRFFPGDDDVRILRIIEQIYDILLEKVPRSQFDQKGSYRKLLRRS